MVRGGQRLVLGARHVVFGVRCLTRNAWSHVGFSTPCPPVAQRVGHGAQHDAQGVSAWAVTHVALVTAVLGASRSTHPSPKHPDISLESTPAPHHPVKPPRALPCPAQPPWRYLGRGPEASTTPVSQSCSHTRLLRGCPHQGAMPGSCRASPHPHALSVQHWLRRGARRGRGTQGTPLAGRPGRAEPGRKPLREGSSGLTNKSLTASPEAGGRKQAPWL